MTTPQARRIVIFALAAGAVLAVVAKFTSRQMPSPRIAVGAFVAAVILLALADAAPKVAAGVALTSLISGAIAAGPDPLVAFSTHITTKD